MKTILNTTCPLCGSVEHKQYGYNNHFRRLNVRKAAKKYVKLVGYRALPRFVLVHTPLGRKLSGGLFADQIINVCADCGTGYLRKSISEDDLNDYYKSVYWQRRSSGNIEVESVNYRGVDQYNYLALFVDFKKIDRILEFGAGQAGISRYIKSQHPSVEVSIVETSEKLRRAHLDRRTVDAAFASIAEAAEQYSLFISSHSLEHVFDINRTLADVDRVVKPGDYIFFEVPNCNNLYWNLSDYDAPHTYFFNKRSFEVIAVKLNWQLLDADGWGLSYYEKKAGVEFKPPARRTDDGIRLRVVLRKSLGDGC